MAELGEPRLNFDGDGPGFRQVALPPPLPTLPDDFDWMLRDYESFLRFMWDALRARFPERMRWTAVDVEAVLVEALAALLDQLSDMADRVHAEATLETARHPKSVYGWLRFIGYDPTKERAEIRTLPEAADKLAALLALYASQPHEMERDRRTGPSTVHRQRRMATLADYAVEIAKHPLVLRAQASEASGGAWPVVTVVLGLWNDLTLDARLDEAQLPKGRREAIDGFHGHLGLRAPNWAESPTAREILHEHVARYRMVGQEVCLRDVRRVAISLDLRVNVGRAYFQSEVRRVVENALGRGPEGFFAPERLRFGEDLHLSDLYELLMPLDGVDNVEVVRLGRTEVLPPPGQVPDTVRIRGTEVAGSLALALALVGGLPG